MGRCNIAFSNYWIFYISCGDYMRAEELIKEFEDLVNKQNQLIIALKNCKDEDWEWVCVKKASEKLGLTVNLIYGKIRQGKLTTKKFNGKTLVSVKELQAINDKEY